MGEPEQQITSRPLAYQLQRLSYQRQEAIIGALIMCLSTISIQHFIQNIYSRVQSKDGQQALSILVGIFAMAGLIIGLSVYFNGLGMSEQSDRTARNKGLIYGLGAANVSLAAVIICPWIDEQISLATIILLACIGMVIGNLQ
jgi:uncharacterized protein YacL